MAQAKNCPSCGAPLSIKNRFVKLINCEFCDHVILIHDKGLDPTGRTSQLAEFPSILYVDATGKLNGKPFQVVGRIRYQSETAYWDEWFLTFEGGEQPGWLVEDEGNFTFFNKKTLTGSAPPFESVSVGSTVSIAGQQVFISEKGVARIAGGEGQLAFRILPGEQIKYLDGSSGQDLISVEYAENEIEFLVGQAIDRSALAVDEEDFW
jgi:hypothetical protein